MDHITGTAANETFSATGATFTATDTLVGGGGTDTLNIADTTGALAAGKPAGVSVSGIANVNLTSTGTIGAAGVTAVTALKQVDLIGAQGTGVASGDYVTVTIGGVAYNAGTTLNAAGAAETAIVNTINAVLGYTAAAVVGGRVYVTAQTAGTALPTIAVATATAALGATPGTGTFGVLTVPQANVPAVAGVTGVAYDVSGFTGTTAVVGNSVGGANITAAATTAVTATDTTGAVTLSGGLTQTVHGVGAFTLSGSKGAIVATETGSQAASLISILDGTTVNLTSKGQTTGTITVGSSTHAPTGDITVTPRASTGVQRR